MVEHQSKRSPEIMYTKYKLHWNNRFAKWCKKQSSAYILVFHLHGFQFWCRPSNQCSGCIKSFSKKTISLSFSISDLSGPDKRCLPQVRDQREQKNRKKCHSRNIFHSIFYLEHVAGVIRSLINRDECFLMILKLLLSENKSLLYPGKKGILCHESEF